MSILKQNKMEVLKKGSIVIAPEGCSKYLTPNKEYEVIETINYNIFEIKDDDNENIICKLNRCGHLNGKNWILKQ